MKFSKSLSPRLSPGRCLAFAAVIVGFCLSVLSPVCADTRLELEETEITGARELPKVLYIVPWKKTQPGGHSLPMRSLIDEALSPIDVDVFKRQVRYHELTQPPVTAAGE